jgi:hypothetical protein
MLKTMTFILSLLLAACGGHNEQAEHASSSSLAAQDTIFGNDLKALDRARHVEDTLNQDRAHTDAAIDAAATSPASEH